MFFCCVYVKVYFYIIVVMKIPVLIVLSCFYLKNITSLDCYWNTQNKYTYFASKTPYENVRGDLRDSIVKQKGCEPISIWAMIRHGKRNPGIKFSRNIKDVLKCKDYIISSYENGNSSLCAQDVQNLRNFKIDISILNEPSELSNEGYQELMGISSRLKASLPHLLYDLEEDDYFFQHAFGTRMQVSAEAFIEGLNNTNLIFKQTLNSSIVAPYGPCDRFQDEVFQNQDIYYRVADYMNTTDYLSMKERVEKRLGLNFTLSDNNITAMYDVCRYSWEGIANKPSPWCAVFSVDDLKVLEYITDLEHYSRNSYGISNYSQIFGQIPLANMLRNFQRAKNGRGKKIVTYITHAAMLDMILVALNLYKDSNPLTGACRDLNRKWRTTFLSTFAGNIIAILNRCKIQSATNEYDYNIAFYWNEKPLLEMCSEGVCSWQQFVDKFKPFLNANTDFCEYT